MGDEVCGSSRTGCRAHGLGLAAGLASLVACLAVIHTTQSGAWWAGDCASRALLAERLLATHYADFRFEHPARDLDPEGLAFPLPHLAFRDARGFTSIFPVAYAALGAPLLALGGAPALRWPAALGSAACAALFAVWLAPCVGRRSAAAAGLALGLATPLLFYGSVVWEHSASVALGLAACVLVARPEPARLVFAGAWIGLGCWLREELVLLLLAFACACAATQRRTGVALPLLAGALPPLAALVAWNALAYGDPLGPHTAALDPAQALALSLRELPRRVAALVVGFGASEAESLALAGLAVTALGSGAAAEWRGRHVAALALATAFGLAAWLYAGSRALSSAPLVGLVRYNGWIAQLPAACLAGAGAIRLWRDPRLAPLRPGVLAGLLFLLAASAAGLVTQSVFGTGVHVGPRLLMPALPALAALALVALHADAPGRARRAGRLAAALVVAAGAASSARGVWLLAQQQAEIASLERALRAQPERVVLSGDAMLTQLLIGGWHEKPLLYARRPAVLRRLVAALRARGDTSFLVLAPEATPIRAASLGARCELVLRQRGGALGYVDTDLLRCTLAPPASARKRGSSSRARASTAASSTPGSSAQWRPISASSTALTSCHAMAPISSATLPAVSGRQARPSAA